MRVYAIVVVAMLLGGCRVRRVGSEGTDAASADASVEAAADTRETAEAPRVEQPMLRVEPWLIRSDSGPLVFALSGSDGDGVAAQIEAALARSAGMLSSPDAPPEHVAVEALCALERADAGRMLSAAPLRRDGLRSFDALVAAGPRRWGAIAAAPEVLHPSHAAEHVLRAGAGILVGPAAARWDTQPALHVEAARAPAAPRLLVTMVRAWGVSPPLALPAALPAPAPPVGDALPTPTRPTWVLVRGARGGFAAAGSFGGAVNSLPGQVSALVLPGVALWVGDAGIVALASPSGRDASREARELYAHLAEHRSARLTAAWSGARVAAGTSVVVMSPGGLSASGSEAPFGVWTEDTPKPPEPSTEAAPETPPEPETP